MEENLTNPPAQIEFINAADLSDVVSEHERVVVDITGDGWCAWCELLDAIMGKFIWQYPNLHFAKIDFEEAKELPPEFEVEERGVPHLLAFENGKLVTHGGFEIEYAEMAKWFAAAAGTPDPHLEAAYEIAFAATADATCAAYRTTVKEKCHPFAVETDRLDEEGKQRREALQATHAAGLIPDADLESQLAQIDANTQSLKDQIYAKWDEVVDAAIAAYRTTVSQAVELFIAAASADRVHAVHADAPVGDALAPAEPPQPSDGMASGAVCNLGDKNCGQ